MNGVQDILLGKKRRFSDSELYSILGHSGVDSELRAVRLPSKTSLARLNAFSYKISI